MYPGVGRFISSKVLKPWNFAKNDHKNVKLASLRQCHFYAQRKIPEPKYFHEPLQASPSRIHPPRLQPFPQTHSPTLRRKLSPHHFATIPKKHPPYYISIIHFFPSKLSLFVFQRGRQGGARGGTAAFATVSEFPLGFFSHLPNSGIPGSTRPCNYERVPPRMVFIFAKYKKI